MTPRTYAALTRQGLGGGASDRSYLGSEGVIWGQSKIKLNKLRSSRTVSRFLFEHHGPASDPGR